MVYVQGMGTVNDLLHIKYFYSDYSLAAVCEYCTILSLPDKLKIYYYCIHSKKTANFNSRVYVWVG